MRRFAPLAALLMLAACAPSQPGWMNPRLPKEQWGTDQSACRRWAESQVVGEREANYGPPGSGSGFQQLDRDSAKGRVDRLVADCMRGRGYVPAKKERD